MTSDKEALNAAARKLGQTLAGILKPDLGGLDKAVNQEVADAISRTKKKFSHLPDFIVLTHLIIAFADAMGLCAARLAPVPKSKITEAEAEKTRLELLSSVQKRAEKSMRIDLENQAEERAKKGKPTKGTEDNPWT